MLLGLAVAVACPSKLALVAPGTRGCTSGGLTTPWSRHLALPWGDVFAGDWVQGGECTPQAVRQRISDLLSEEEKIDGLENVEVKVFK